MICRALLFLLALLLVGCADNPGPKPWWLKGEKHFYLPWN